MVGGGGGVLGIGTACQPAVAGSVHKVTYFMARLVSQTRETCTHF